MGAMFDEINCKYPLPNSDLIDTSNFQTKFRNYYLDEYSCQDKFIISDVGDLILNGKIYHFTGWIEFHTYKEYTDPANNKIKYCVSFEYWAEFFRGKLFSIKDCTTVESKEISCREISYDEFSKRINSDYWNQ
jgi:hypothetical protein